MTLFLWHLNRQFYPLSFNFIKKKLIQLGFTEFSKYSVDGWTCFRYEQKWLWVFLNDSETIMKAEPDDPIELTIEEIEDLLKLFFQFKKP